MSNGQVESRPDKSAYVEDRLRELTEKIEKQYELFNISKISIDQSCRAYLTMSEDSIQRLSPEELAMAEIKLSSYAFSIQKHINTANAIKNWADRSIVSIIAKTYKNFDPMTKYEVRRELVVQDNEYASRLNVICGEQQVTLDEFAYLAQAVQHVSDAFGKLARIRRKERE